MKKTLTSLFIISSFYSCGKDKFTPYEDESIKIETIEEFEDLLTQSSISSDSPEALAFLVKRSESNDIGTCTGFFVDEETVITNSHCIPSHLRENGVDNENCKEYINVTTKTKDGIESVSCHQILFSSKIEKDILKHPDYAYIKVERKLNFSQTFSPTAEGVKDNIIYAVHTFNTLSNNDQIFGEYEQKNCLSKLDSLLLNRLMSPFSKILLLFTSTDQVEAKCNIIPGNSGSPITEVSHKNKGISYQTIGNVYGGSIEQNNSLNINFFIFINNFSCLPVPPYYSTHKNCTDSDSSDTLNFEEYKKHVQSKARQSLIDEIDSRKEEVTKNPSNIIDFEISYLEIPDSKLLLVNFVPECFKSPSKWSASDRKKYYAKKKLMTLEAQAYTFKLTFNAYGEPVYQEVYHSDYSDFLYEVNFSNIKKNSVTFTVHKHQFIQKGLKEIQECK